MTDKRNKICQIQALNLVTLNPTITAGCVCMGSSLLCDTVAWNAVPVVNFPKSHGIKAAAQANLCLKYHWAILVTIIIGVVHLLSNCLHRLTEPKERYKSKLD